MSYSVKKGDFVKIIAGNDKGKFGQIVAIDRENGRVTVEGKDLSVVKKAVRARKANDKAGIVEMPKTYDISNVMPVCAACGKATRVRHAIVNGKKVRICAKCGEVLETKKAEKKKTTTRRKKTTTTTATTDATATEAPKTTVRRRKKTEAPAPEAAQEAAPATETVTENSDN